MKKWTLLLGLLFNILYTKAQSVEGAWYGTLAVQGTNIHLVFHISKTGDIYTSTFDSPDQGANGLATDKTTFINNQLTIDASQFKITYTGTYRTDSAKIAGIFKQGGIELPLNLFKTKQPDAAAKAVVRKPQDPVDFPYKQEDVLFTNAKGGNQLAGTLTLPQDGKFSKAVVLISGSGAQNRNEELLGHRPFLVWSDYLTRHGIAVLRYDDRGVSKSTGDFSKATSADFADDAEAAVAYLKARPDMKDVAIGLMGHSEGGLIAPMIASRNKNVAFIVLLAGPGVPIPQLMAQQTADQSRLSGASADVVKMNVATNQKLYNAINQYPNLSADALKVKLDTLLRQDFRSYPAGSLGDSKLDDIINQTISQVNTPWFRYFMSVNPSDYLTKVTCPVLALNGTLDMQVNSIANLAAIKNSLQKADNKNHQEVTLPGLNHLFQKANTGSVAEYGKIEETVNPVALEKVSVWISQL
ncbi:alpha/beta fold hydrolase [Mucilaginibacter koreensis]